MSRRVVERLDTVLERSRGIDTRSS